MVFEICKVLGRIVSADSNIEAILAKIAWDKSPLIPTIAQDSHTKEVLMLAYSSAESLRLSLEKGIAHYFSRSKNRLWQKGEESGNVQTIHAIHIDCDNDAILLKKWIWNLWRFNLWNHQIYRRKIAQTPIISSIISIIFSKSASLKARINPTPPSFTPKGKMRFAKKSSKRVAKYALR